MNFPRFVIKDPKLGLVGRSKMSRDYSQPMHIIGFDDYTIAKYFANVLNTTPHQQKLVRLRGRYNVRVVPVSDKLKRDIIERHMGTELVKKIYYMKGNNSLSFDTQHECNERKISYTTTIMLEESLRLCYDK
jgi:hypothetical protein